MLHNYIVDVYNTKNYGDEKLNLGHTKTGLCLLGNVDDFLCEDDCCITAFTSHHVASFNVNVIRVCQNKTFNFKFSSNTLFCIMYLL